MYGLNESVDVERVRRVFGNCWDRMKNFKRIRDWWRCKGSSPDSQYRETTGVVRKAPVAKRRAVW